MGCETKNDIKKLEQLKSKLVKNPNNVELLLKIGMLLFDPFIDMDEGLPYFEKAIKLDPKNPDLPFWTGYALYHDQCAYEKSKKLFEQALSLDPNRSEFHYMIFYVLWHMTEDENVGLKHLLKAIKLQPEWIDPRTQYVTYLIDKNKFNEAKKELSMVYKILNKQYKTKKRVGINTLEKYYINNSGEGSYELTKSWIDGLKRDLEKKEKQQQNKKIK